MAINRNRLPPPCFARVRFPPRFTLSLRLRRRHVGKRCGHHGTGAADTNLHEISASDGGTSHRHFGIFHGCPPKKISGQVVDTWVEPARNDFTILTYMSGTSRWG